MMKEEKVGKMQSGDGRTYEGNELRPGDALSLPSVNLASL